MKVATQHLHIGGSDDESVCWIYLLHQELNYFEMHSQIDIEVTLYMF